MTMHKGVEITEKNGKFYLLSPINGTQRIFRNIEFAKNYIDRAKVAESHARAIARNPW